MLSFSSTLAPYATHAECSRGRYYTEEATSRRSPFQRDRDRILHCSAFRRLEYKTQVFVNHVGDHYRTRLTHSLEVAGLARSIARALRLDEDLAEALALAHDMGHTPFGHAGEDALHACMRDYGGFDHNAQALRIVTQLELKYLDFPGLNLSWETLEGMVKHNGPIVNPLPFALEQYQQKQDLELHQHAGLEAQVAALADDIAYHNHDLEDGLRAGLFTLEELQELPLIGALSVQWLQMHPDAPKRCLTHEILRRSIHRMVEDVIVTSTHAIAALNPMSVEQVRAHHAPLICFSTEMAETNRLIKQFLFARMYRHSSVNRMSHKARHVVSTLFKHYFHHPECLPERWQLASQAPSHILARQVADFIAGMTDRFALEDYRRWED